MSITAGALGRAELRGCVVGASFGVFVGVVAGLVVMRAAMVPDVAPMQAQIDAPGLSRNFIQAEACVFWLGSHSAGLRQSQLEAFCRWLTLADRNIEIDLGRGLVFCHVDGLVVPFHIALPEGLTGSPVTLVNYHVDGTGSVARAEGVRAAAGRQLRALVERAAYEERVQASPFADDVRTPSTQPRASRGACDE